MPYRIELHAPAGDALERLIDLGALDVAAMTDGVAALMPDAVPVADVTAACGPASLSVSPAIGRDDGSVWILEPRAVQVGGFRLIPSGIPSSADAIVLTDGPAFGTGLHPTTALCLELLGELTDDERPERMLDVGTGSGVLALAALRRGVPRAAGIDLDPEALQVAAENARLNELSRRLRLVRGGPESVSGRWPLVIANVLAAPLVEMAPALAQRVAGGGRLVLSGIAAGLASDVERAYRRLGMAQSGRTTRAGWSALVLVPSW